MKASEKVVFQFPAINDCRSEEGVNFLFETLKLFLEYLCALEVKVLAGKSQKEQLPAVVKDFFFEVFDSDIPIEPNLAPEFVVRMRQSLLVVLPSVDEQSADIEFAVSRYIPEAVIRIYRCLIEANPDKPKAEVGDSVLKLAAQLDSSFSDLTESAQRILGVLVRNS